MELVDAAVRTALNGIGTATLKGGCWSPTGRKVGASWGGNYTIQIHGHQDRPAVLQFYWGLNFPAGQGVWQGGARQGVVAFRQFAQVFSYTGKATGTGARQGAH